jgi:ATP-dependent DNA helicase RecQ
MRIGDRILPHFPGVPALLFTATSPVTAQKNLIDLLHLNDPEVVSKNPDRPNIAYVKLMRPPSQSLEAKEHLHKLIAYLCSQLQSKKLEFPITIVYTDTQTIAYSYWLTEMTLKSEQYIGEPIPENRIFAQYHQVCTEEMKKHVIAELCKENCKIRLVFATVALGMGLDAPNIRHVIHYKPPTSLEKYFQETGRAGRDGMPASATLFYNNTDVRQNRPGITNSMIAFCKSEKECIRDKMLEYFGYEAIWDRNFEHCCSACNPKLLQSMTFE